MSCIPPSCLCLLVLMKMRENAMLSKDLLHHHFILDTILPRQLALSNKLPHKFKVYHDFEFKVFLHFPILHSI